MGIRHIIAPESRTASSSHSALLPTLLPLRALGSPTCWCLCSACWATGESSICPARSQRLVSWRCPPPHSHPAPINRISIITAYDDIMTNMQDDVKESQKGVHGCSAYIMRTSQKDACRFNLTPPSTARPLMRTRLRSRFLTREATESRDNISSRTSEMRAITI